MMEARTGFEPVNHGFANRSLNHLGIAPSWLIEAKLAKPNSRQRKLAQHADHRQQSQGGAGSCLPIMPSPTLR